MSPRFKVLLIFLAPLYLPHAHAQQMDFEAMLRWTSAEAINYHIVGEYNGDTYVASNGSARGDVVDQVTIDMQWQLADAKLIGTPTVQNTPTVLSNLRDFEPGCLPPEMQGEFEFYDVTDVRQGLSGDLELTVNTRFPVVRVAQACTASRITVPAKSETVKESLFVLSPVMFSMPVENSDNLSISPDKKSLVSKQNGWTWTFTPSIK